jgi:hypothetical protein
MVEILNFKYQATIMKLNTAVTNLNVRGILMSHFRRDKNTENIPFNLLRWEQYDITAKSQNSGTRRGSNY